MAIVQTVCPACKKEPLKINVGNAKRIDELVGTICGACGHKLTEKELKELLRQSILKDSNEILKDIRG